MIYMIVTMGGVWDWEQKTKNDADVCTLAEILKEEDDDEDEESEENEEEKEKEKKNNDNETEATDEILKKLSINLLLDFLLQCQFRSTHCRRIYPTLCTEIFKPQESPQI